MKSFPSKGAELERPDTAQRSALPAAVPSPCINVCRMQAASGLWEGCPRTFAEIAGWTSMSEADKRETWLRMEQRLAVIAATVSAQAPP